MALLRLMIALLLMRPVLLIRVMVSLLLMCGRRVRRMAAVLVVALVALLMLVLGRGAVALLRDLTIGIVRRGSVGALQRRQQLKGWALRKGTDLSLRVGAMVSLAILIMRLLSIWLVLWRITLVVVSSVAMLLLVCAVVAVAVALTVALALSVVVLT
jgi:hypothetical protein